MGFLANNFVKQAIKKTLKQSNKQANKEKRQTKGKPRITRVKAHKQYGTSKLEEDFAHQFLDKLKVEYVYQFEAKDIGRFYDFYLPNHNLLIEIDGDYYHSKGLVYEEMSPMQKKNKRVDELKNKWALLHCIPIMRIWESDIRKRPSEVIKRLKERLYLTKEEVKKKKNKRNRH